MAIKGQVAKDEIANKILEMFEGSFKYEKEIRIPVMEEGQLVQIKVALTAAKVNVEPNGDVALPGGGILEAKGNRIEFGEDNIAASAPEVPKIVTPTETEKKNVADLLKSLGMI